MNLNEVREVVNHALAESMTEVKKILEEHTLSLAGIEERLIDLPTSAAAVSDMSPATAEVDHITNDLPADIVNICEAAGMPELSGMMIRDGLTINEAKETILDAKAKAAENATIISTVGPLTAGETNPVLADAKKRAAEYVVGSRMAEKKYEL